MANFFYSTVEIIGSSDILNKIKTTIEINCMEEGVFDEFAYALEIIEKLHINTKKFTGDTRVYWHYPKINNNRLTFEQLSLSHWSKLADMLKEKYPAEITAVSYFRN